MTEDEKVTNPLTAEARATAEAQLRANLADDEKRRDELAAAADPGLLGRIRERRDRLEALKAKPGSVLTLKGPIGAARLLEQLPVPDDLLRVPGRGDTAERGFLRAGIVGMLAAPGGLGKSQALIQLAVSVATGLPWLDRFDVVKPGKVLLLLGEEPPEELARRVQRTAAMMGLLPEKAHELGLGRLGAHEDRADDLAVNLWAEGLAGRRLALQSAEKDKPTEEPFAAELRAFLADNAGDDGWRLVVLDPLSRFAGPLAEKDNYAATVLVETLELLRDAPGKPAVLVAHHTNKGALSGGTDQGAARGSSALVDGVRWVCNLELVVDGDIAEKKVRRDRVRLNPVKSNYGPGLGPVMLARERFGFLRALGEDELEEPTTTAKLTRAKGSKGADKAAGSEEWDP